MTAVPDIAAMDVIDLLRSTGSTVAAAESLTGGLVCATLIGVPGASDVVRGGVVAYTAEVKIGLLGVDPVLVAAQGTVSADVAEQMALRVRELCGATYGLATTGVAGPGASEGHPPGTVHVAVAGPSGAVSRLVHVPGDRDLVRHSAVAATLSLLVARLGEEPHDMQR